MSNYFKNIVKPLVVISFFYCGMISAQMWSPDYQNKYQANIDTKSRSSSIPNDPLLFPNDILPYHQYHLKVEANGFSIDYPATWQYARGHALLGMIDVDMYALHPDITDNYRNHLLESNILTENPSEFEGIYFDHGSWVMGVLAPGSNNNEGLTGVCQDCSVVAKFIDVQQVDNYLDVVSTGVQAINMSFGGGEFNCTTAPDLCVLFENEMVERDIVMVGISQNRHNWVNIPLYGDTFPGSHPDVIKVGGLNESLQFWNNCEGFVGTSTCGSLASQYQELVAPAKNILTAITYTVNGNGSCGEINNPPGLHYDICSGNSFAAPQVTGLVGIIRSIYPQLSAPDVRLLLQKTAQSPHAERHDEWGYGLIDPLATVTEVLGTVAAVQQTNRSIPVFAVRNLNHALEDTAFSSSPQFIAALLSNSFRSGYQLDHQPLAVGLALNDYKIPSSELLPYAAFYILGTHNNPLHPGKELSKLYRMSKLDLTGTNSILDHAYVTSPYLEQFKTDGYEIDTIEGYIFPACDAADENCLPPAHSECLIARNIAGEEPDWAIMLQSQLSDEAFENHTVKLNDAANDICLGYAYLPIDSDNDGLIDGYEAFLGTDINQADSDGDGRTDGEEMLEPIEAMFSDPLSNTNSFAINEGLTGTWYYPETSGQGLMIDVMKPVGNDAGRMFAAWFTYDLVPAENNAEFGNINHRWFSVSGTYVDDKADLAIVLNENGRFDDPQATTSLSVGQMQIRFTGCTSGVVSYIFDQTDISGSFPITRLSPDQFCEDDMTLSSKPKLKSSISFQTAGGLSGTWYNPQTSGQGFMFDVMESRDQMFAAWFTYSIEGNSPGVDFGSGDHRWFSAQGAWSGNGSEMTVLLSEGGVFDRQSSVTNQPVGTLQVTFDSCTSGSVEYQFSDLDISGSFPIQRLTPNVFCQEASGN